MATENKEELIKKIVLLEAQVLELKKKEQEVESLKIQIIGFKKSNDEISASEHNQRRIADQLTNQLKEKEFKEQTILRDKELAIGALQKQVDALKMDLTNLASLFDEYIIAYQDQVKMLQVFVKNTQTVEKYLTNKIDAYNKGDKK
jgi:hypothetical protein